MRKQWTFGPAIVAFVAAQSALAGNIDEGLKSVMNAAQAGDIISTLVFLNEQVDIDLLNAQLDLEHAKLQRRHEVVVRALQQVAADTQDAFLNDMRQLEAAGRIERLHAYWISNVFRVDAAVEEIEKIASHASVKTVYFNYPIELIEPVESNPGGGIGAAVTNSLREIRAPQAWALGYDGSGILVSNMDTGVAGGHPALAERWAGVADPRYAGHPEWAWFDPFNNQNDFPYDGNGHGTHTMGTVCGGAPGEEIGVAPGAIWMASAPIDRGGGIPGTVADALLSFEWMLDPDGNPSTNWDVPAVCSNSWGVTTGHGFPPCDDTFWSHLDACEAAGIVILFSAGNEGFNGLRRPADRATDDYRTCAVAAVDCESSTFPWPIAGFSSRGPTQCTPDGRDAIKPDISAPGVDVFSASPGGGYRRLSGTSMASPHVNGVVALIRQACPDLTVPEVKQVLYDSAVDLGPSGEDNDFGWGNINAEAAVLLALGLCIDSEGQIDLDREKYACEDQVNVIVRDIDLNLDPNIVEVVDITIESDSEPAGEIITLTETGPDTSRFEAVVPISETDALGTLLVADSDTIVATYNDDDNGQGLPAVVTAEATVDCTAPQIMNVRVIDVQARSATIAFDSDEPVFGIASYGPDCDSLNDSASGRGFTTTPTVEITGLQDNTTYFFEMEAEDEAGNRGADPACYSFTTPEIPDFFTEQWFPSGFDLAGLSVSFIPDGGPDFYVGCDKDISALPTNPVGGTRIFLSDDSFARITPPQSVSLYGTSYTSFFVGSNGYITFQAGDSDWTETLADHFRQPRISGAFDDLNPAAGGRVSWKDTGDRVAVTWRNVPQFGNTDRNTFQIEIFYADGTIRVSYLTLGLQDCIAGLSEGNGLDPDFLPTDLSNMGACNRAGDLNCDGIVDAFDIEPFLVALFQPDEYSKLYPDCDINLADINGDGAINAFDIEGFLALLFP